MRLLTLGLLIVTLGACGGDSEGGETDVEAGVSCTSEDECGSLTCHCVRDDGEFPGVCSTTCEVDEDCAEHGDDYSCSLDFCEGVNVCLRLTR